MVTVTVTVTRVTLRLAMAAAAPGPPRPAAQVPGLEARVRLQSGYLDMMIGLPALSQLLEFRVRVPGKSLRQPRPPIWILGRYDSEFIVSTMNS
jgi:hypothetical protein